MHFQIELAGVGRRVLRGMQHQILYGVRDMLWAGMSVPEVREHGLNIILHVPVLAHNLMNLLVK